VELTIEQALQQGVVAHKEGNLQEAERLYRAILQSQPAHPDANHNLGVIAVSVNKAEAALPLFKTALEANPKIEQFWLSYIDALIKENQLEAVNEALAESRKMGLAGEKVDALEAQFKQITQSARSTLPKKRKGLTLKEKRQKISESKQQKKKGKSQNANSVSPSQSQLKNILEQYKNGQYDEAEKLAVLITQQYPEHKFGWKILGAVFGLTGREPEALNAKQKAVQLAPQDAEAHNNLGKTLRELGSLEEAEGSYRQAIALKSDYAEAHSNLGITLQALGRLEEAEVSYSQAIALKSGYAKAHRNLGSTLQALGRLEEAEACYRQAIALKPDYAEAHRSLTMMKKFNNQDEQFVQMQALTLDENSSEEQCCHLSFALAKAAEDLGTLEKSFKYYAEGNALRKKILNYDISQDIERFEQLKSSYPEIKKSSLGTENLSKKLAPIFIVGMPRSGTTLVEQVISSHSRVTGAGELPYVVHFGDSIARGISIPERNILLNFRETYLEKLQTHSRGNQMITDKMPQNFRYIGLLTAAFPDAKIVHVKRNPAAVCWSNYKQLFESQALGYCYALNDIVKYYALYENLMEFWEMQLDNKIYNIDYESLTINQEEETKKLIQHLGLNWEKECLSPQSNRRSVATASNAQVRAKVYQGSSQQWKKFKPFLNGELDCLDD
jgi:tetratricopeptide (TPR) repeat protein